MSKVALCLINCFAYSVVNWRCDLCYSAGVTKRCWHDSKLIWWYDTFITCSYFCCLLLIVIFVSPFPNYYYSYRATHRSPQDHHLLNIQPPGGRSNQDSITGLEPLTMAPLPQRGHPIRQTNSKFLPTPLQEKFQDYPRNTSRRVRLGFNPGSYPQTTNHSPCWKVYTITSYLVSSWLITPTRPIFLTDNICWCIVVI